LLRAPAIAHLTPFKTRESSSESVLLSDSIDVPNHMRFLCRRGTREFSIRSIFIDREPSRKNHFGGRRAFVASLDAVRQPWFSRKPVATLPLALVWFLYRADDKIAAQAC
jgi:hypothetical protein